METLTTLKVLHVAATVVILASGLVLAALTWRNRSEGSASTMQRPWLFIWCLMLIGMLSMPFTGWWLVHLIGWPLGQFWILGSSVIYAVATFRIAGSDSVMTSGLVATRCDSMASLRRTASSAARRSVSST